MVTLEQKIDIILECITRDNYVDEGIKQKAREALAASSGETYVSVNPASDVDDMILNLFKELGISPGLKGYMYAFTAVKLAIVEPRCPGTLVKGTYAEIASKYGTTPACVDRSIRTVVAAMVDRGDFESICDILGNIISHKNGNIQNGAFIASCAQEITRRMKRLGFKIV